MKTVGLTKFVTRQTEYTFAGTQVTGDQLDLLVTLSTEAMNSTTVSVVKDGYADFVKIVSIYPSHPRVPDLLDSVKCPIVEITSLNERLLMSGYKARREEEVPVLTRWFHSYAKGHGNHVEGVPLHHIDVVLYTREQLDSEGDDHSGCDFDIVSVNAELEEAAPMKPMTMMRNALGKRYGGSGAVLDPDAYAAAVMFWDKHAMIA